MAYVIKLSSANIGRDSDSGQAKRTWAIECKYSSCLILVDYSDVEENKDTKTAMDQAFVN